MKSLISILLPLFAILGLMGVYTVLKDAAERMHRQERRWLGRALGIAAWVFAAAAAAVGIAHYAPIVSRPGFWEFPEPAECARFC